VADRKDRNWARGFKVSAALAAGADGVSDILASYKAEVGILEIRGRTVGTVIGELVFVQDDAVPNASNNQSRIAFGIGVVNTLLGTATPIPGIDSYNWMWYKDFHYTQLAQYVQGIDGSEVFRNVEYRIPIHIRSMRKLGMNEFLVLKTHNFSASVNFAFAGNILLLG